MLRRTRVPSPAVILPRTSIITMSATCRVDACILTGTCSLMPTPKRPRISFATFAASGDSVRTITRLRPVASTSRKNVTSSGLFSSGLGCATAFSLDIAFPTTEPAPAPARPRSAAAPKPSANTCPMPGTTRSRAAPTPAVMPVATPINPPTVAPSSLPTDVASASERVRNTIASCGTFCANSSCTACSARSREENTPMAVSKRYLQQ